MPGLKIVLDTGDSERSSRQLKKDLAALGSQAVKNEKEFERLEARMDKGLKAEKAKKSFDNLNKSINLTRLETVKLKASIGDYGGALKTLAPSVQLSTSSIVALGAAMASVAAISAKSLSEFSDLDSGLIGIQKTTNATDSEMISLKNNLLDMANKIPVARDSLLEIAAAAGQLGVKGVDNITLFTDTVARLQLTTDLVGEDGAKALARIINVSGETVDSVDELGSVIVALGNNMAASESEIVQMASEISRSVSAFEVSAAASTAYGAALKSMGAQAELSGSAIGRSMVEIEKSIISGGEKFEYLQETTGMTGEQIKKTFKTDSSVVFNAWIKGMSKMVDSGESAITLLEKFGMTGVEQIKGLTPLVSNVEELEKAFELANSEVENSTALMEESIKATESFKSQITFAWNAVDEIAASIGSGLAPAVIDIINDFRTWTTENKEFIRNDLPSYIGEMAKSVKFLGKIFGDTTKNIAINSQALALATQGYISWGTYITSSTNELKLLIMQFDAVNFGTQSVTKSINEQTEGYDKYIKTGVVPAIKANKELTESFTGIDTFDYKKQISEIESFYADYDKATLSSADYQEKALDASYDEREKLVEQGLISQLELEDWFFYEWLKIQDKKISEEEKARRQEERRAEKEKTMREQMEVDLIESPYEKQLLELEKYVAKYEELGGDMVLAEEWKNKEIQSLNEETAMKEMENREESFSQISSNLSSIASLYEEGSKQQEIASAASKAAYAVEMGMLVQKNLMIAVGAVAQQGTGDPYTAFARIAAMTAVISGVLSIANIDFSSGGGGGGGGEPQRVGLVSGTGTVLGDESAMSESVSNSMEFLQDIEAEQYSTLVDIYYEMNDLNKNITALASSVVRSYGDFSAQYFGISEGFFAGGAESVFEDEKIDKFIQNYSMILLDGIGGMLGGFANDLLGGLAGNIFGGGQSKKLIGSGFKIDPYTIGQDLLVQSYQDVKVEEEGGWFHSDKSWTETKLQAVDDDISKYFQSVLDSFSDISINLAESLGYTVDAAEQYVFDLGKINLMDLEGKEIEEALNNVFSEVADTMTEDLFYDVVKPYQEIDEGMYEAAIRLVSTKAIIENAFDKLGVSFSVTATEAIDLSQDIADLSGDLEAFQKSVESFYEAFYFTFEQQSSFFDNATKSIQSVDSSVGFPKTKEALRELVEGLDVTTDSGKRLFTILMSLSSGATEYYKYLEEVESFNSTISDILTEGALSEYGKDLKSLSEWYEEQKSTADDLGVSLEKLNEAYSYQIEVLKENFRSDIDDILVGTTMSEYAQGLRDLDTWYKEQVRSAKDLGIPLDDLNKAYKYQLELLANSELSESLNDATNSLSEAKDVYTDALNAEIDQYETIYDQIQEEIDAKGDLISENEDLLDSFKTLKDEIAGFQSDLVLSSGSASPEYQLSYAKSLLDATVQGLYSTDQSEVQSALANLPTVSKEYLDLSQKMNVNELDQIKALGYVQEILNTSQNIANVQIDKTEDTVYGLYAQNAILEESQVYYQTQIDSLGAILEEISGTNNLLTMSLEQAKQQYIDAQKTLETATSDYNTATQGDSTKTLDDTVRSSYETLVKQTFMSELGRAGKPAGIDYWVNSLMDDSDPVDLSNFKEAFRNAAVEQGELSIVGSGIDYESIVKNMFWSKLGRAGKPAGIDYWVNSLIDPTDSVDLSNFEEAFLNAALASGEIPAFADGGTVYKPTFSLIGEGGQAEHVTPDSQMQGVKNRLDKIYEVLWTMLNLSGDKKESMEDLLDIFDRNTMGNLPFKTEAA